MKDLEEGSKVRVKTPRSTYKGIVAPQTEMAGSDHFVIKLSNGYNIGVSKEEIKEVEKLERPKKKSKTPEAKFKKSNPDVSLVSTGGTITSKVDYETGGVSPCESPDELLALVPELADFVNIKNVHAPFQVLSENMGSEEWSKIAELVHKELKSDVEGVIVTHGTDTLHYTSAALSFMIQDLNKPVAVVGAQRSEDRGSFDGAMNLTCGAHYCLGDIAEIATVMHGSTDDKYCLANRGVNARKMSTSRRDTFRPINELPLAKIWPGGNTIVENGEHNTRSKSKPKLDTKFEEKVALTYHYPGANPGKIDYFIDEGYKGIIIAGTGFGHVSTKPAKEKNNWLPKIESAVDSGLFVGMTSQAFYGKTDPMVYSAGRMLKDAGVVYLKNMLPETAYVKLGWVLGHTKKKKKAREMMLEDYAGEFVERIDPETFLY